MDRYIGLRLEIELFNQIRDFGKKTQRTVSGVIRLAIIEFLERNK